MVRSAPQVSFSVESINYGTIDVGASATTQYYDIYMPQRSNTMTEAIHMSISIKDGANSSECREESWVWVSAPLTGTSIHISSIGFKEASIGSIVAGRTASAVSVHVGTNIVVPSGAATAGAVSFYLHHRYQYTGDDDDYASDY